MRVGDPLRQHRDDRVAADVGPSPGDLAPRIEGDAVGFRIAPREPGFPRIGLVRVARVGLRPWRIRCRSPGRSARSRRRALHAGARTTPPCGSRRAATGCRECGRRRSRSCGRSHKASWYRLLPRDCFAALAMTIRDCHCEEPKATRQSGPTELLPDSRAQPGRCHPTQLHKARPMTSSRSEC